METKKERLISHASKPQQIEEIIADTRARIISEGEKSYVSVERQLALLDQLTKFEFGLFLLQNKGLNGSWTHHLLTYSWFKENNKHQSLSFLEQFLYERAPAALATQKRFTFFLQENQKLVSNNKRLACIPSGMMGELLYLNYDGVNNIELYGIDLDENALQGAKELAEKKQLVNFCRFINKDAWKLDYQNEFDLISSNGLNIYEPEDEKVTEIYKIFNKALKPQGKLVTSFLTFPPNFPNKCEWKMDKINAEDLLLQRVIFVDIIGVKWQCFRTTEQTRKQLEEAGFINLRFIADESYQFPTVVAQKP